jgi:hypothetical protein
VINFVHDSRLAYGDSLPLLKRNRPAYDKLIKQVLGIFWNQPLWRLQRIGDESLDFLYANRTIGTRAEAIELLPGVSFCLQRFHLLINELVRGAWLDYVRKFNAGLFGRATDLADFLFGSARCDVAPLRPVLMEVQHGQCFYCAGSLRVGQLDHFIPWSRYPADLGHNFVLADDRCNSAKGALLAAEEHFYRWIARNATYENELYEASLYAGIRADLHASLQIARWAYEQAASVGALLWVLHGLKVGERSKRTSVGSSPSEQEQAARV